MDITCNNFWAKLPEIIQAIADASHVSIDIEMSGVQVKKVMRADKLSIQEAYAEAREAAETFQILQMGLTCIRFDEKQCERAHLVSTLGCDIAHNIVDARVNDISQVGMLLSHSGSTYLQCFPTKAVLVISLQRSWTASLCSLTILFCF